jgi:uncharacterized protein YggE
MKRFLFLLVSFPMSIFAEGGLPNQPYIYVEGKAEIQKPADLVTIRLEVHGRNVDEAKANQDVQAKAAKSIALLNNSKIAEKDVVAGDLSSEAEYENEDEDSPRKRGKFVGYKVNRRFVVKVRDISTFPKLVDELLAIGSMEFAGIEAGLSNEKELEDEVWDKALTDARQRAEKTLKAPGMKIDSIFAISPVSFPSITRDIFERGATAGYAIKQEARVNPSQYRLAPVTVTQSVHVIYLISPIK